MRLPRDIFRFVFVAVALVAIAAPLFSFLTERANIAQPIAFNHKKHTGDLSLPCTTCHQSVEAQTFAGLPQTETCATCHAAPLTKNPEEEKIRQYASKGEKIPWQRIYRMPGDVFFSHRRHVVLAKVECATCHGKMAEQTTPPSRPLVNQTMAWCINCHQERRVSVDCNACHK
jgi:invasion protein IalB